MAKHRKKVTGPCAYCSEERELTVDHVIPECLFPRGKAPATTPIVHACRQCNNAQKNQDDSYLRDMLAVDFNTYDHPVARELLQGPVLRAANAKDFVWSPIVQMVRNRQGRDVPLSSRSGIYLGKGFIPDIPEERIQRIFSTIVRGLSWAYTGKPLPPGVQFNVQRTHDLYSATEMVRMAIASGGAYQEAGDGSIFQCVYGMAQDRPDMTVWFLAFYQRIVFVVNTENPDLPRLDTSRLTSAL